MDTEEVYTEEAYAEAYVRDPVLAARAGRTTYRDGLHRRAWALADALTGHARTVALRVARALDSAELTTRLNESRARHNYWIAHQRATGWPALSDREQG